MSLINAPIFKFASILMDCSAAIDINYHTTSYSTLNYEIFEVSISKIELSFHSLVLKLCQCY